MDTTVEKDCSLLEDLFQLIVNDMKNSFPVWEDFATKGTRLHSALKTTTICLTAFLESFQKVADMSTGTKGLTREIGSALTRLCLRHQSIETKMKGFTNALMDLMIVPLGEKMEEWKKSIVVLDRDHAKENKRAHQEIKKAAAEALRQQKKLKKAGKQDSCDQLDRVYQDLNDKLLLMREMEKASVKSMLIEERSRLCLFVSCLKPVMDEEVAMLSEVTHLQEIVHSLCMLADDPESLPPSGEQIVTDLISGGNSQSSVMQPASSAIPGSPGSEGSVASSSGGSIGGSLAPTQSPTRMGIYQRSQSQPNPTVSHMMSCREIDESASDVVAVMASCLLDTAAAKQPSNTMMMNNSQMTGSLSSTNDPLNNEQSDVPIDCSRLLRANKVLQSKDYSQTLPMERPHTISSAYERSFARPIITSETYMPPDSSTLQQQGYRPQSTCSGSGTLSSASSSNPYAVPCIIPKRRQTQVGDCKTADIYARPSLVPSKGGYRTPNIKPLPVATPTVPDFGTVPAFPATGYVNMNQLAHMALQHQQELSQRKDQPESGMEEDIPKAQKSNLEASRSYGSVDAYNEFISGQSDMSADSSYPYLHGADMYQGDPNAPSKTEGGINLHDLAVRLARACQLESLDKYCTLPRRPAKLQETSHLSSSMAGISALYGSSKEASSSSYSRQMMPITRAFSVTGMPLTVATSPVASYGGGMLSGGQRSSSQHHQQQSPDCWKFDSSNPDANY